MTIISVDDSTADVTTQSDDHDEIPRIRRALLSHAVRSVWLWPALVTALLGAFRLARPEPWRDELATWDAASRTTGQLFALLGHTDASTGAYYLLMHQWIAIFGASPVSLRMPSLLAMTAAAALTALSGKRMFSYRAGLAAGLVFAVLPAVSRYAQEARVYALTMFAAAMATWLLLRAFDRPGWRRWPGYTLVVAVTGALNMVALAMVVGHAAAVVLHWWRERDRRLLIGFPLAAAAGMLLVSPLAIIALRQVSTQLFGGLPAPDLLSVFDTLPQLFCSALVAGAVVVVAMFAIGVSRRSASIGVVMATLPMAAVWIVAQWQPSYWVFPRYLLFTLPAWALLAGAGIAALKSTATLTGGVITLTLIGVPDHLALRAPGAHDWFNYPTPLAPAGQLVPPPPEPGERLLTRPAPTAFTYSGAAAVIAKGYRLGDGLIPVRDIAPFYMIDTGLRYNLPADVRPRDIFADRTGIQRGDFFTQDTGNPAAALGNEQRLWLVTVGLPLDPLQDVDPAKAQVLRQRYTVTQVVRPSTNTTVALLERKP